MALSSVSSFYNRSTPMFSAYSAPLSTVSRTRFGCQEHDSAQISGHKDEPSLIDAYKPDDQNLSRLQQWCLKAIAWYQRVTRYRDKDGNRKSRILITCPYNPSCSSYTAQAIREHGAVKGIMLGAKRIFLKCNPITIYRTQGTFKVSAGSIDDPVPPKASAPQMKPATA